MKSPCFGETNSFVRCFIIRNKETKTSWIRSRSNQHLWLKFESSEFCWRTILAGVNNPVSISWRRISLLFRRLQSYTILATASKKHIYFVRRNSSARPRCISNQGCLLQLSSLSRLINSIRPSPPLFHLQFIILRIMELFFCVSHLLFFVTIWLFKSNHDVDLTILKFWKDKFSTCISKPPLYISK